jgi:NAD(P)-dependent dehydrogenase (short-subunit alcohol dehydrogenase family)
METLSGRIAVVTGGASGIGLGIARRFLKEGMKVVIADVDTTAMTRATEALAPLGEVFAHRTDVADAAQVQALADAVVARFGAVHVLVNNAGVGGFQRFENTTLETWRWTLGVNLWGPINGCKIFLPILAAQDEAHIVNTASMAGFNYIPYLHPYSVTKAALVALSEGLYLEFQKEKPHIGVSVLCPAYTATNIPDDERNAPPGYVRRIDAEPDLEPIRQAVNAGIRAGKSPDELAEYVVRGIRSRALHIFSHEDWTNGMRTRIDRIAAGLPLENPFANADFSAPPAPSNAAR